MRKLSENRLWDIYKKSAGLEIRKEDEQSPFFGPDIVYRLYKDGDKIHFTYYEALEIEKKEKGWRLPTIDEIREIITDKDFFNLNDRNTIESIHGSLTLPKMGYISETGKLLGTKLWYIIVKSSNQDFYVISNCGYISHKRDESSMSKKYSIVLLYEKVK